MATYTPKVQTVEAVQFVDSSTKSDSLEVRAYDLEDGKRICERCGQTLNLHGVVDRDLGAWGTICPGEWQVTKSDGTIERLSDADFAARYEEVKA